jgi:hypothetical protein
MRPATFGGRTVGRTQARAGDPAAPLRSCGQRMPGRDAGRGSPASRLVLMRAAMKRIRLYDARLSPSRERTLVFPNRPPKLLPGAS